MTLGGELTDLRVNLCLNEEKAAKVGCKMIPRPTPMAFLNNILILNRLGAITPATIKTWDTHVHSKCVSHCLELIVRNKAGPYHPKGEIASSFHSDVSLPADFALYTFEIIKTRRQRYSCKTYDHPELQ